MDDIHFFPGGTTLETYYQTLFEQVQQTPFSENNFSLYNLEVLSEPAGWFKGLAFYAYALQENPDSEQLKEFQYLLFSNYEMNATFDLKDTDYEWFWNKKMELLTIHSKVYDFTYTEIAASYKAYNRQFHDQNKYIELLRKGAEQGIEAAMLSYGSFLYNEGEKETGKEWIKKATGKEIKERKLFIKLQIAQHENRQEEVSSLLTEIENSTLTPPLACTLYEWKGYFNELEGQHDMAVDNYRKACTYLPGGLSYNRIAMKHYQQAVTNPLPAEDCLQLFEKAVRYGHFESIGSLWYLYSKSGCEFQNIERGIYWLEKGVLYNQGYAANELADYYLSENNKDNLEKGMSYLDKAIELNYPDAYVRKAWHYFQGEGVEKDENKALELLKAGMELGSGNAAYRLGYLTEQGVGTEDGSSDYSKALSYYEKAAELGYLEGYERAGLYHLNGYAGEENMEKCLSFYEKGSSLGSPYCKVELGLLYLNGTGVDENEEMAFTLFKEAVDMNYYPAFYFLGRCYKYKWGTEENPDKAFELFEKAAEEDHVQSMAELAICYENGYGTESNGRKAVVYMKRAAEKEYAYAQYKVGCYYLYGLKGTLTNYNKAFQWFKKAVEQEYPHAYLELGDYYFYDYNNIDEQEKAYALYEKGAQLGVLSEGLGLCLYYGIGVDENEGEAFKYLLKAAEEDCIRAEFEVGRCYYYGRGIKKNYGEAYRWFDDAANYGHRSAIYYKAKMLVDGDGVIQNLQEGVELMGVAAERGSADAQYELGNYYLIGKGVEENEDLAMEWFEKAADSGHKQALKITGRSRRK